MVAFKIETSQPVKQYERMKVDKNLIGYHIPNENREDVYKSNHFEGDNAGMYLQLSIRPGGCQQCLSLKDRFCI